MVLVKILGGLDILASMVFLSLIFGITPLLQITLFFAGFLLLKGMFILTGDILSAIDLFSAALLLVSIFTLPFSILLWTAAFLLLAKGFVSFL
tara:strand:+ start:22384 stop:22662 length:279 start_codon:yes stop_codon:yes gene_type:complete